ncbi:MAG: hypothetical protein IPM66_07420 [Acidobacteriota bacterium]|nr:MAG: hypothetical protein IPM66_07420 [Acidobacteriota bacterium]
MLTDFVAEYLWSPRLIHLCCAWPIWNLTGSRSRSGGAGLGLAIVKSIVTAHGGHVNIESDEGRGSRFRVSLPRSGNNGK